LIEQGRVEGEAKGRVEGEAKGRVEGEAKALVKLLTAKFGGVPESVHSRIRAASVEELDAWIERVLTAPTLDAVFASA
jgi:hypothetical protein